MMTFDLYLIHDACAFSIVNEEQNRGFREMLVNQTLCDPNMQRFLLHRKLELQIIGYYSHNSIYFFNCMHRQLKHTHSIYSL
jgi:hypothetical protein